VKNNFDLVKIEVVILENIPIEVYYFASVIISVSITVHYDLSALGDRILHNF